MKPIFLAVLLSLLPAAARAQVFINQAALDQLAGVQSPVPEAAGSPVVRKAPAHRHLLTHVMTVAVKPAAVKPVAPAEAPPPKPAPVIQPIVAKPAPLPPLAPVTISFAAGDTDLPADAGSSLQPICSRAGADGLVSIDAYGPLSGNDASAPMRTSLTRAFAVRDALTACGVPAAHIIPRADGAVTGKNPDSAVVSLSAAGTGK